MSHPLVEIPPGTRALVVEDSKATRRIFKSMLESLAIHVTEAEDGQEAMDVLRDRIADLDIVFSDISMPRMDGFALCHTLLQEPWYDGTPVVLVSTQSDAANVIQALKLGADDYLPKPFNLDDLKRIAGRVLTHG